MTSSGTKWHQVTSSEIKWDQVASSGIKWHQVTSDLLFANWYLHLDTCYPILATGSPDTIKLIFFLICYLSFATCYFLPDMFYLILVTKYYLILGTCYSLLLVLKLFHLLKTLKNFTCSWLVHIFFTICSWLVSELLSNSRLRPRPRVWLYFRNVKIRTTSLT